MKNLSTEKQNELNSQLIYACVEEPFDEIKKLIEAGADIHAEDGLAFCHISYRGNIEELEYFFKRANIKLVPAKTLDGAVDSGNIELVQYLLNKGLKFVDNTVLSMTTKNNDFKMLDFLLDNGLKFNEDGQVLDAAAARGNFEMIKYLVEEKNIDIVKNADRVLYSAARYGYLDMLDYCVQKGVNIHESSFVLYTAIANKNCKVIQHLVCNHNVDPRWVKKECKGQNVNEIKQWCNDYLRAQSIKEKLEEELISNTPNSIKKIKL